MEERLEVEKSVRTNPVEVIKAILVFEMKRIGFLDTPLLFT